MEIYFNIKMGGEVPNEEKDFYMNKSDDEISIVLKEKFVNKLKDLIGGSDISIECTSIEIRR